MVLEIIIRNACGYWLHMVYRVVQQYLHRKLYDSCRCFRYLGEYAEVVENAGFTLMPFCVFLQNQS